MLASPLEQDTKVDITDLTHASVEGNGVFDVLMRAVNAHLQKEWSANRLKGTEYSTVYLGALESTMNASLQFLLARDKTNAELDILKQQLVNLKVEEVNAGKQGVLLDKQAIDLDAATALKVQQRLNVIDELLTATAQRANIANEIDVRTRQVVIAETQSTKDLLIKSAQIVSMGKDDTVKDKQATDLDAATALKVQQKINVIDELLTASQQRINLASENLGIISRTAISNQQLLNLQVEKDNAIKQGLQLVAQTAVTTQQKINLEDELLTSAKQRTSIENEIDVRTRQIEVTEVQSAKDLLIKTAQIVSMGKDDEVKIKQALQIAAQTLNTSAELINIGKQSVLLDKQATQSDAQTTNISLEGSNIIKQGNILSDQLITFAKQRDAIDNDISIKNRQLMVTEAQSSQDLIVKTAQLVSMSKDDIVKDKQASQITQQTSNLVLESLNIPKQGIVLDTQIAQLSQQTTLASAETKLVEQKYVGRKQ